MCLDEMLRAVTKRRAETVLDDGSKDDISLFSMVHRP